MNILSFFYPQIRHTHVQDGEAGGITQQIGATMVPPDAIRQQTSMIKEVSIANSVTFSSIQYVLDKCNY